MAMEVTGSKNLHEHAVPVVVLLLGLLLVTGLVWYGNGNLSTEKLITRGLMTRLNLHDNSASRPALDQVGQTAAHDFSQ
jgi:hypothetical protein